MKQLRVGPFTVTKQITSTTYETKEDENPENVKVTHRNHLLEDFPKEETLPPLLTNYAPIEQDDNFYKHLIQSQIDKHNSGQSEHKLDLMPLVITPLSGPNNNTTKGSEFSSVPILDSFVRKPHNFTLGYHLRLTTPFQGNVPITAVEQIHFHLCKHHASPWQYCHSLSLPTLLPKRTPVLPSVPPDQISPKTGKLPNFKKNVTTRFSEKPKNPKYERSTPGSSLRDIERKAIKIRK